MVDALGVLSDRGIVRFVGIAEEFLATNGMTVLAEIENLRNTSGEEGRTEGSRLSRIRSRGRRTSKPQGLRLVEGIESNVGANPPSPPLKSPPLPDPPTIKSPLDIKAEKMQKMGRRRSILALFGK